MGGVAPNSIIREEQWCQLNSLSWSVPTWNDILKNISTAIHIKVACVVYILPDKIQPVFLCKHVFTENKTETAGSRGLVSAK
jgi:hypothetical protein